MTDHQYQDLAAGRETDLLIAEKIFGKPHLAAPQPYGEEATPVPYYSANDKDANELIEAVFEKFHPIAIRLPNQGYSVMNYDPDTRQLLPGWDATIGLLCAQADTLALAFCRFTLMWFDLAGGK